MIKYFIASKLRANRNINAKGIFIWLLDKLLLLISPFIKYWEHRYINKYSSQPLKHQPIFIIGAPRTGSTILYQMLTNHLDITYISNLAAKLYRNIFFGIWLSNIIYKKNNHNNFISIHGDTTIGGYHAPNECGSFWYRWLPTDRHYVDENFLDNKSSTQIKQEITAITNYYDKPIAFKNLNAALRMRMLSKLFPEAKFIWIKRNPIYVSQSILIAREKINHNIVDWWSLMPFNYEKLKTLGPIEQVVEQIFSIEKQINNDIRLFSSENLLILHYENFDNYSGVMESIHNFIGKDINLNNSEQKPSIIIEEKYSFREEIILSLKNKIETMNWLDYTN